MIDLKNTYDVTTLLNVLKDDIDHKNVKNIVTFMINNARQTIISYNMVTKKLVKYNDSIECITLYQPTDALYDFLSFDESYYYDTLQKIVEHTIKYYFELETSLNFEDKYSTSLNLLSYPAKTQFNRDDDTFVSNQLDNSLINKIIDLNHNIDNAYILKATVQLLENNYKQEENFDSYDHYAFQYNNIELCRFILENITVFNKTFIKDFKNYLIENLKSLVKAKPDDNHNMEYMTLINDLKNNSYYNDEDIYHLIEESFS